MRHSALAALILPVFVPGFMASSAQAADLPGRSYAPAPVYAPPPTPFSWTGFYAGLNAGYGWASFGAIGDATFGKPSGFNIGGTFGYNYQSNQLVVGLESDLDYLAYKSTRAIGAAPTVYYTANQRWMGTLRARVGFAADRALVYVTGGYAGGKQKASYESSTPVIGDINSMRHGWAVGAGIEYAFTNAISAKAEFLYASLAKRTMFPAPYTTRTDFSASAVRMGVNYHF